MLKESRDNLAQKLIKTVNETDVYSKKVSGKQIQLDKINDILAFAGITEKIKSLGESFGIVA